MEVEHLKGYIGKTNRRVKHSDRLIASLKERNRMLKLELKEYKKELTKVYRITKKINAILVKEIK